MCNDMGLTVTSVLKSHSGDGVRFSRFCDRASLIDGEHVCGSSGMTAKRPRCKHGDGGPYVSAWKWNEKPIKMMNQESNHHFGVLLCELIRNRPCVCSGGPGEFGGHTRNLPIRVLVWSVPLFSSIMSVWGVREKRIGAWKFISIKIAVFEERTYFS